MEIKFKMEDNYLSVMAKLNKGRYYGKMFQAHKGLSLDALYEFLDQVKYETKLIDTYGNISGLIKEPHEERTNEENDEIWKNF